MLATDGRCAGIGEPVGKLTAGDEVLRPRVRILADEHLTGASRDAVQARLDLWLKTHLERLLGPLFALAAAEDITGIARGVAFQLTEALGVLERAQRRRGGEGPRPGARATLRKYGVRFGAYHLYLPNLLKPGAARARGAALGAEGGGPDTKGLDEVPHLGVDRPHLDSRPTRTCRRRSIASSAIACAASARCASIFWSGLPTSSARRSPGAPGSPAPKPPGAIEGGGFTVTGDMTSLTGSRARISPRCCARSATAWRSGRSRPSRQPAAAADPWPTEAAPAKRARCSEAARRPKPATSGDGAPQRRAPNARRRCAGRRAGCRAGRRSAEAAPPADEPAAEPPSRTPLAGAEAAAPKPRDGRAQAPPRPRQQPAEPEMIEVWRPGPSARGAPAASAASARRRRTNGRAQRRGQPPAQRRRAARGSRRRRRGSPPAEGERQRPPRRRRRHRAARRSPRRAGQAGEAAAMKPRARTGRPPQRERRGGERPDRDRHERRDRADRRRAADFKRDRDRDRAGATAADASGASEQEPRGAGARSEFAVRQARRAEGQLEANKERA